MSLIRLLALKWFLKASGEMIRSYLTFYTKHQVNYTTTHIYSQIWVLCKLSDTLKVQWQLQNHFNKIILIKSRY